MGKNNITVYRTTNEDAKILIAIQREAFKPLYERYHDPGSPYLRDESDILDRLNREDSDYFTIMYGTEIVGGILYKHNCSTPFGDLNDGEYYLCRVYIKPALQGKQIARTAILLCEKVLCDAKKYYLDFPVDLEKNRMCYESVGYTDTGKRLEIKPNLTLACYEKNRVFSVLT